MAKAKAQVQFEADTQGFNEGIKSADQQLVTLRKELKLNGTELKENADNTDLLTQRKALLQKESEQVSKKVEYLSSSLDTAKKMFGDNSKEVYQLNNKLLDARNQYQSIQNESKILENNLNSLSYSTEQSSDSINDISNATNKASDGFTIMKGAVANLVADGLSSLKTEMVELVSGTEDATSKFQAATGASKKEIQAFKEEIEGLYAENYGESMEDIADAMAEIKQQTGEVDPSKLKELTKNSLALRDTFGYDVKESIRAVNMLMSKFGLTSEQAFNLVVQGAQSGLDKNGDLLDTINEYSVHYAQMGVSAEGFFNSLINGTDSGTFSVDKLGDAYKEFGIRVKDNSDSTKNAFKELGLNAEQLTKDFNAGGDSALKATELVRQKLFNLDNQVKKNEIGVSLFGTMWEDLGERGVLNLTEIQGGFNSTEESMKELDSVRYDNISSQFSELGRIIKIDILGPVVEKLLPSFKAGINWLRKNMNTVIPILITIGTLLGTYFVVSKIISFVDIIKKLFMSIKAGTSIMSALNVVMSLNPIGLIIAAIAGLITMFVLLWNKCDWFRNFWGGLWNGIVDFCKSAIDKVKLFFSGIVNFFKDNWQGILLFLVNPFAGAFKLLYDNCSGFRNFIDNFVKSIKDFFANGFNTIKDKTVGVFITMKDNVVSGVTNLKNSVINTFNNLKDAAGNIFNKIKNIITEPIKSAKNLIKGWIDDIKGFFRNLSVKIKLPHFKIKNGSLNPADWIKNGVPKLSVDWYAKGAIFTKPTIFSTGSGYKGVAEQGAEGILPISNLKNWINSALKVNNLYTVETNNINFSKIEEKLDLIIKKNISLYVGAEKIAEATSSAADNINGVRYSLKDRGLEL